MDETPRIITLTTEYNVANSEELCRRSLVAGATPVHSICLLWSFLMKSSQVLVHCKPEILNHWMIKDGNLYYTHNTKTGEIDVLVTDVPYEYCDGYYQDPDEQL